jgi:hypothetical protein
MKTFSVKNFDRFQHYKDRNPPWIKLYNELLDDYEFGRLQDASKMHLVAIWLLASRSDNKLPYDPEWIGKRINATEPVNLDALAAAGFIISDQSLQSSEQDASALLAKCLPRDRGETETETEGGATPPASKPVRSLEAVSVDPEAEAIAAEARVDPRAELAKFTDYCRAKGRVYKDYRAAFHNWLRNANNFGPPRKIPAKTGPKPISVAEYAKQQAAEFERLDREHGGSA